MAHSLLRGLCFAIAGLIYSRKCPRLVSSYRTFAAFESDGLGEGQIRRIALDHAFDKPLSETFLIAAYGKDEFLRIAKESPRSADGIVVEAHKMDYFEHLETEPIPEGRVRDAFWALRDSLDLEAPNAMKNCLVFYALGIILLAVVFAQNTWYVCKVIVASVVDRT